MSGRKDSHGGEIRQDGGWQEELFRATHIFLSLFLKQHD